MWRVMALLAASGVSKSTRPQPLDLPPGCLAASAWTTVPTWEQWAVGREERAAGGAVMGLVAGKIQLNQEGEEDSDVRNRALRARRGGLREQSARWDHRVETHR